MDNKETYNNDIYKNANTNDENPTEEKLVKEKPMEEQSREEQMASAMEYVSQRRDTKEKSTRKAKKKSYRKGFFAGGLLGIIIGCAGLYFGVMAYCSSTGMRITIGAGKRLGDQILDQYTMRKVTELTNYIDAYYIDEFTADQIKDSMLSGLVEGLGDKYSAYFNTEDYADMQVSTNGVYYGIGAGLSQNPDTMEVTIIKIYEGTPSEEAGLLKDDMILYVDDIAATSLELSKLVDNIRGEEGTSVHLTVYRPSTEETLEFDVERRNVELPSVTGELLEDGIGYISVAEWQKNTAKQFGKIVDDLANQGMQAMIVDVRSNPGGLLNSVTDVLDSILPEGTLVYTEDKQGKRNYATSDPSCMNYPMAVLIDGNSASASEIFAGAIKDYEYGTLIGTTTFGKGIVQTVFPLSNKDAIKLTTAKYFTPNGNYIHGVGISPDIELEYEYTGDVKEAYDTKYDNQVQKAIEVLKDEMED